MRDDALQLIPGELRERAFGDRNRGVGGGVSRRERIDGRVPVEHEDLRDGHATGDGHLLDDVQQPLRIGVVGTWVDEPGTKRRCDGAAATRERAETDPAREADAADHDKPDGEQRLPIGPVIDGSLGRRRGANEADPDDRGGVNDRD